jgi:hypothetical protein
MLHTDECDYEIQTILLNVRYIPQRVNVLPNPAYKALATPSAGSNLTLFLPCPCA